MGIRKTENTFFCRKVCNENHGGSSSKHLPPQRFKCKSAFELSPPPHKNSLLLIFFAFARSAPPTPTMPYSGPLLNFNVSAVSASRRPQPLMHAHNAPPQTHELCTPTQVAFWIQIVIAALQLLFFLILTLVQPIMCSPAPPLLAQ
jgi:hypothetical protein